MTDLTQQEILGLAKIAGMTIIPEDVEEVTHRLNALLEALTALDQLPLENVQPLPALPHPLDLP
jgi:Asp-tRNA(Asn)/Glu-tRNA(Gln) amidotransferase C subunit